MLTKKIPHLITRWEKGKMVEKFWSSDIEKIYKEYLPEKGYFICVPPPTASVVLRSLLIDIVNVCLTWLKAKTQLKG